MPAVPASPSADAAVSARADVDHDVNAASTGAAHAHESSEIADSDAGEHSADPLPSMRRQGSSILTIGFGTTVAMWTIGYITHLPAFAEAIPQWLVGISLIATLAVGGVVAGRYATGARRGMLSGAIVGCITALLNLLIFGSILYSEYAANVPSPAIWIPGYFVGSAVIAGLCGSLGRLRPAGDATRDGINWVAWHAAIAVLATGLLIIAGGLVTGLDAGLAVPDWPGSFGYNMFLYPLCKMTGAVYFEHAHRLYGALVGLTTLALCGHLHYARSSRGLIMLAWIAVVSVIVQGIMGGYRVSTAITGTDGVAVARPEHETLTSEILRVAHGAFGQIFLAMMVVLAAMTAFAFGRVPQRIRNVSVRTDRQLSTMLVGVIITQLVLGAMLRHLGTAMYIHVTFAGVVGLLMVACGIRIWGIYGPESPMLRRLGLALLFLLPTQIVLGFTALAVVGPDPTATAPTMLNATLSTAHQAVGAAILATAAAVMALTRLQLLPAPLPAFDGSEAHRNPVSTAAPA